MDQSLSNIPYSVLDLAVITEGQSPADAIANSRDLAKHVEKWGYTRFWMAEHHNMENIASSATSVLIGHMAEATSTLRIGSGGVMLPNHSPLIIAEHYGTLATMYPDRIDLGLGRARYRSGYRTGNSFGSDVGRSPVSKKCAKAAAVLFG